MALSYPEAIRWYYSFARFDTNITPVPDAMKLPRLNDLFARLGNPHRQFPSLLIAGTKGKGSTAALVESILHAAGYRTGLYTSPHLHSFRERITVNGELISKLHVVQGTTLLQTHEADFPSSRFFEWVTALAFDYFARQRVEIAVVEVGLGGRLDSTNVLTPRVAVIAPISFDHMDILGDTLEKIAFEKAGIIKPNVPVVVAPQELEAMQGIEQIAQERNALLVSVADEWKWELQGVTLEAQMVQTQEKGKAPHVYHLPLLGPHQRVNLATALATIQQLREQGWKIPQGAVQRGIERVAWKGRFEMLARPAHGMAGSNIVADALHGETYIVADGAHNRASAHALVRTLAEVFPDVPVHFIFGASSDKDIRGMLDELIPRATSLVVTRSHHARAAAPESLGQLALTVATQTGNDSTRRRSIAGNESVFVPHMTNTLVEALLHAKHLASPGDVICITGSLFMAAEAREHLLNLPPDE